MIARIATVNTAALVPPGPNRTAAQSSSGSGAYRLAPEAFESSNTSPPTPSSAISRMPASRQRRSGTQPNRATSRARTISRTGSSVRPVSTFDSSHGRNADQVAAAVQRHDAGADEGARARREDDAEEKKRRHPLQRVEAPARIAEAADAPRGQQRPRVVGHLRHQDERDGIAAQAMRHDRCRPSPRAGRSTSAAAATAAAPSSRSRTAGTGSRCRCGETAAGCRSPRPARRPRKPVTLSHPCVSAPTCQPLAAAKTAAMRLPPLAARVQNQAMPYRGWP